MNRKYFIGVLIFALIVSTSTALAHMEDAPLVTDLIADGGSLATEIDVGDVLVWNDDEFIYIKIETTDGWCATNTKLHLFLDDVDFTDIPITRSGNPKVGKFDIKMDHSCAVSYDVPPIPLGDWLVDTQLWIAAHADVQKTIEPDVIRYESAWAEGDGFPGKNWSMYFGYVVQEYCCDVTGFENTLCGTSGDFWYAYTYDASTCDLPGQFSYSKIGCFSQQTYWTVEGEITSVDVVDNTAELMGAITSFSVVPDDRPVQGTEFSLRVWDNSPDRFQIKWGEGAYIEPVPDLIEVDIICGDATCPCFDANDILGQGIDYATQALYGANCLDILPDAIQLDGYREDTTSESQWWVANAVYTPVLPVNQCYFSDAAYGIDNSMAGITDAEVGACLDILLNSQMFSVNGCPTP